MNITKKFIIFYIIWTAIVITLSLLLCSNYYYEQGFMNGYITACKNFYGNILNIKQIKCNQTNDDVIFKYVSENRKDNK